LCFSSIAAKNELFYRFFPSIFQIILISNLKNKNIHVFFQLDAGSRSLAGLIAAINFSKLLVHTLPILDVVVVKQAHEDHAQWLHVFSREKPEKSGTIFLWEFKHF
jgi:hypothetical protein